MSSSMFEGLFVLLSFETASPVDDHRILLPETDPVSKRTIFTNDTPCLDHFDLVHILVSFQP